MSRPLELALDESLARLREGETLESCLQRYPQYREQLEPLLKVASGLSRMVAAQAPAEEAVARARTRFMAQVYERRAAQVSLPRRGAPWRPAWQRGLATAGLVVMLVAFLLGGTGIVSANSLPGDPLYGVKLASENVRIWFTPDLEERLLLQDHYESLRIAEVKEVIEKGRETEVSFSGVVERIEGDTLIVQGIPVQLSTIDGAEQPAPGTKVRVTARTKSDGTVAANALAIRLAPDSPTPPAQAATTSEPATATATVLPATLVPSPTATERAQAKPANRDTPTRTATVSPGVTEPKPLTPTAEITETVTGAPTATPSPTKTLSPTALPWPSATPTTEPTPRDIRVRIEGRIDEITGEYWRVHGQRVNLRSSTVIDETVATAELGGWAAVQATKRPDGTLFAQQITVLRGPEQTPALQEFSGVIESLEADHWVVAGRRVAIVSDTVIEGQPKLGLLAHMLVELRSDGGLVAKSIKIDPESEDSVQIEGIIERITEDFWVVAGREIWLDAETEIVGEPAVGAIAEVEAVLRAEDRHWARRIDVQTPEEPTESPTAWATTETATPPIEQTATPEALATLAAEDPPAPTPIS